MATPTAGGASCLRVVRPTCRGAAAAFLGFAVLGNHVRPANCSTMAEPADKEPSTMDERFCAEGPLMTGKASTPGSYLSAGSGSSRLSSSLLQVASSRETPFSGTASLMSTDVDIAMQLALKDADQEVAAGKSKPLPVTVVEGAERKSTGHKQKKESARASHQPHIVRESDAERDGTSTGDDDASEQPSKIGVDWSDEPFVPQRSCQPLCKWQCESTRCEGDCTPECEQPTCETRCSAVNTKGCVMECDQPQCYTVCPKRGCAGTGGCPLCTTHCSKPMCRLRCPQRQDCKGVCEEPKCKWRCKEPSACPVPKCHLACEEPACMVGSASRAIPVLKKGELRVASFVAPANLLQLGNASSNTALYQVSAGEAPDRSDNAEIMPRTVPVLVQKASEDSSSEESTVLLPVLGSGPPKHPLRP